MKRFIILLSIVFVCFCSNRSSDESQSHNNGSSKITKNDSLELFEDFFLKFCYEEEFQVDRIRYPLIYIKLNQDFTDNDTLFVSRDEWKYNNLGFDDNVIVRYQFFDDFSRTVTDTDQKVFALRGIRDGLEIYCYFQRIKGLWYLVKFEDSST